jgi:type I restriction enzyme S subunit
MESFALHYLRLGIIQQLANRLAKGNAVRDLQLGDMKSLPFYCPPIEIQKQFCKIQDHIKDIMDKLAISHQKTEMLFSSLQQRAFTGELFTEKAAAATQQELFAD